MKWVGLMNNIKVSAEEIILKTWYMCECERRDRSFTLLYILE